MRLRSTRSEETIIPWLQTEIFSQTVNCSFAWTWFDLHVLHEVGALTQEKKLERGLQCRLHEINLFGEEGKAGHKLKDIQDVRSKRKKKGRRGYTICSLICPAITHALYIRIPIHMLERILQNEISLQAQRKQRPSLQEAVNWLRIQRRMGMHIVQKIFKVLGVAILLFG